MEQLMGLTACPRFIGLLDWCSVIFVFFAVVVNVGFNRQRDTVKDASIQLMMDQDPNGSGLTLDGKDIVTMRAVFTADGFSKWTIADLGLASSRKSTWAILL
jgi:hypothetical protein